jgi:hypothetical protein
MLPLRDGLRNQLLHRMMYRWRYARVPYITKCYSEYKLIMSSKNQTIDDIVAIYCLLRHTLLLTYDTSTILFFA